MNPPSSAVSPDLQNQPGTCPQCGSDLRVRRGFCLNCLFVAGMDGKGHQSQSDETLDDVFGELDACDGDWRIGNYQVLEEIGRGGMGVIYRARQRHSRRIVAVKRI